MRRFLCSVLGHKVQKHRRFFLVPGLMARCERCGERVPNRR